MAGDFIFGFLMTRHETGIRKKPRHHNLLFAHYEGENPSQYKERRRTTDGFWIPICLIEEFLLRIALVASGSCLNFARAMFCRILLSLRCVISSKNHVHGCTRPQNTTK
jgi:hypothetical protein